MTKPDSTKKTVTPLYPAETAACTGVAMNCGAPTWLRKTTAAAMIRRPVKESTRPGAGGGGTGKRVTGRGRVQRRRLVAALVVYAGLIQVRVGPRHAARAASRGA